MELVSVVIPCFNGGRYLEDAVQSALAQTWDDIEIVIVDDGSTDAATLRLLATARWPRTRVFRQPNGGPAVARNTAIREARGRYILPLDADDTIEPTYVEKALNVLSTRHDVGCVYCKAMKFGAESGPWELPPYRAEELAVDNVIFVTAMFRKEDWLRIGGFDEGLRHGVEDYDFWVKMVASGRDVVQLDEYLFNYRVQSKSRTTRFQDELNDKIGTYARIFRGNQAFYAAHADTIFKHRFGLYAQIAEWKHRCTELEDSARSIDEQTHSKYQRLLSQADHRIRALTARCAELDASLVNHKKYWQGRYGALDRWLNRHGLLRRAAGKAKRGLEARRPSSSQTTQEEPK